MNPLLLRRFWNVVETTQANLLLHLDDSTLVHHLADDLQRQHLLNATEETAVNHYIESKLPLIRDIAQSRIQPEYCS